MLHTAEYFGGRADTIEEIKKRHDSTENKQRYKKGTPGVDNTRGTGKVYCTPCDMRNELVLALVHIKKVLPRVDITRYMPHEVQHDREATEREKR